MRILQVNNTMNIGGIENFLMNIYRNIDKNKYEFIFLTYNKEKFDYEDEIISLGGKILRISNPNSVSILTHIKELYNAIKKAKVDVVHCHTHFNCAYVMIAAKLANVQVRIAHSHSTYALLEKNLKKRIKWFVSRNIINKISTIRFACSKEAGQAIYKNKDFIVLPNGIDLKKYSYNKTIRDKLRKKFNIKSDELVVGHVGRIDTPKNHKFLIEIFYNLLKINKNKKLILIGTGPLENEVKLQINKLNIADKVILLGNRKDVYDLYNMFDVFIFPSIYEGLPLTLVEAQANGLVIIASDSISKEIKISNCIDFYSLNKKAEEWAKIVDQKKNFKHKNTLKELEKSSYSINNTINLLEQYYKKGV